MRQGGNEDLLTSHSLRLNGASDEISKAAHMRESSGVENKLSNQIIVNKVGQIIKRKINEIENTPPKIFSSNCSGNAENR